LPYAFRSEPLNNVDLREAKILYEKLITKDKEYDQVSFESKENLSNGQDLNEVLMPGIYMKYGDYTWDNYPPTLTDASSGILLVLTARKKSAINSNSSFIAQIFIHNNYFFWRHKTSSGWQPWQLANNKTHYYRIID